MAQTTITLDDLTDLMDAIDVELKTQDHYQYGDHAVVDFCDHGVYDKRCIGIVCGNPGKVMFDLGVEVGCQVYIDDSTDAEWSDLADAFSQSVQDTLGRYSILYFPNLALDEVDV